MKSERKKWEEKGRKFCMRSFLKKIQEEKEQFQTG